MFCQATACTVEFKIEITRIGFQKNFNAAVLPAWIAILDAFTPKV
jgi:hypothetical protein